jgi:tetratricopeptide (TPR) repeat protein
VARTYWTSPTHLDLARSHQLRALELLRRAGASEEKIAASQGYLAVAEAEMGHLDEGIRLLGGAIEIQSRHDLVKGGQWLNLGAMLLNAGRTEEARQAIERGLEMAVRQSGLRPPFAVQLLASVQRASGRLEEALRLDREALASFEKQGVGAQWLFLPLTGMGEDLLGLGRPREALVPLERAVGYLAEKKMGPGDEAGEAQFALARALWDSGADKKRARAMAKEARENFLLPAEKYGSYYAQHLAEVDRWLAERP